MIEPALASQSGERSGSGLVAYALALALSVLAIVSQYAVPSAIPALGPWYHNLVPGVLIVYGIPIAAFASLVGTGPLRRFASSMGPASLEGLRWYGLLSVAALVLTAGILAVLVLLEPAAVHVLVTRPNPALQAAKSNPWFWVAFAFIIGAVEETIFRGWIFGFWVARGSPSWVAHALWTSALFAGVHLYYGTTYGVASVAVYPTLFLLGFAFALVVKYSSGNLVAVALLHGANDSTAFLALISPAGAFALHYGIIGVGVLLGVGVYLRARSRRRLAPVPWTPSPAPTDRAADPPT